MKYLIVRLNGFAGNQLFQIANALAKANENDKILLDGYVFNRTNFSYGLNDFLKDDSISFPKTFFEKVILNFSRFIFLLSRKFPRLIQQSLGIVNEKSTLYSNDYYYSNILRINYIQGNWMSEKYFPKQDVIQKYIELKFFENIAYEYSLLNELHCVAVHIRLGDYLDSKYKNDLFVCNEDYFYNAMSYCEEVLGKNISFFIFTNSDADFNYIKSSWTKLNGFNLKRLSSRTFQEDIFAMSLFKNIILSNSTFSWWADYLSVHNKKEKLVLAPKKWNNGVYPMNDIYQKHWKKI
jgi:hypothetical protein